MVSQIVNDESLWNQFDEIFETIGKADSVKKLDAINNRLDNWNQKLESRYQNEQPLISDICDVLRDEIKRREKRLYKPRGKEKRPDWLKSLVQHSQRLEKEIKIAELFDTDDVNKPLAKTILKSLQFSVDLVLADIEQVDKLLSNKQIETTEQNLQLLESSRQYVLHASKLLENVVPK